MNRRDFIEVLSAAITGFAASAAVRGQGDFPAAAGNLAPYLEGLARKVNPDPKLLYCAVDLEWLHKQYAGDSEKIKNEIRRRLVDEYHLCTTEEAATSTALQQVMREVDASLGQNWSGADNLTTKEGKEIRFIVLSRHQDQKGDFWVDTGFSPETIERLKLNERYFMSAATDRFLSSWHEFGHFIRPASDVKDALKLRHDDEVFGDSFMSLAYLMYDDEKDTARKCTELRKIGQYRCLKAFNKPTQQMEVGDDGTLFCPNIAYMTHHIIDAAIAYHAKEKTLALRRPDWVSTLQAISATAGQLVGIDYSQAALQVMSREMVMAHAKLRGQLGGITGCDVERAPPGEVLKTMQDNTFPASPDYQKKVMTVGGEEGFLATMKARGFIDEKMLWVKDVQQSLDAILADSLSAENRLPDHQVPGKNMSRRDLVDFVRRPLRDAVETLSRS